MQFRVTVTTIQTKLVDINIKGGEISLKPITIERIYRDPRTNVIVVHFKFDFGLRSNLNIPCRRFIGLTKDEIKQEILRELKALYDVKKRVHEAKESLQLVDSVLSELEGTEI